MLSRLTGVLGGAAGLASLLLPYALVTGGALGIDLSEESHTLFELAQLLADAGEDPQMVYLLIVAIVVGSALAIAGAVSTSWLSAIGGLVQVGAAGAFAYAITTEGSQTFLYGLGQIDAQLMIGAFVCAAAGLVSLASLPLALVEDAL